MDMRWHTEFRKKELSGGHYKMNNNINVVEDTVWGSKPLASTKNESCASWPRENVETGLPYCVECKAMVA